MTAKLRYEDYKDYSLEEVLALTDDEIATVGGQLIPAGTYNFDILSASVEEKEGNDGNYNVIEVKIKPLEFEFIEGPKGEPADEVTADMVPEDYTFRYNLPGRVGNFRTEWVPVAKLVKGVDKISIADAIEALEGLSCQGTITYYKPKDKDTGEIKRFVNIDNIVPLTSE